MSDCVRTRLEITERLESLGVMDVPEVADSLLELFLDSSKSIRQELSTALENGDGKATHVAAHTLKGSARNLNAERLAELCLSLEEVANSGALQDPAGWMSRVDAELDRVAAVVHDMLADIRAG